MRLPKLYDNSPEYIAEACLLCSGKKRSCALTGKGWGECLIWIPHPPPLESSAASTSNLPSDSNAHGIWQRTLMMSKGGSKAAQRQRQRRNDTTSSDPTARQHTTTITIRNNINADSNGHGVDDEQVDEIIIGMGGDISGMTQEELRSRVARMTDCMALLAPEMRRCIAAMEDVD